uniref:Uncharacterized protein n=1 Tax=Arundo donax TaxID=35708 RepID=A0A0A9CQ51_ARUDO
MAARAEMSCARYHNLWTRLHIPVGLAAHHRLAASGGRRIPELRRWVGAVSRLGGVGFSEALRQLERRPHLGPEQEVLGVGGGLGEGVVDEAAEPEAVGVPAPGRERRPEQRAVESGEGPEVERRPRAAHRRRRRVAVWRQAAALGRREPHQQPRHGEEPRPPCAGARADPGAVVSRHPPQQHSRLSHASPTRFSAPSTPKSTAPKGEAKKNAPKKR